MRIRPFSNPPPSPCLQPHGEDEIKLVVALKPGATLTAAELHAYLRARLPAYMVPVFIEIRRDELPKTPTGKIRKAALREQGIENASVFEEPREIGVR